MLLIFGLMFLLRFVFIKRKRKNEKKLFYTCTDIVNSPFDSGPDKVINQKHPVR